MARTAHPTRLPRLADERQQLAQKLRSHPDEFTAADRAKFDDLTDQLILSLTYTVNDLSRELSQLRYRSRKFG